MGFLTVNEDPLKAATESVSNKINATMSDGNLKAEKAKRKDKGQRTILHLIAKLGMTESQILEASFRSGKIARRVAEDNKTERASEILLELRE